MLAAGVPWADAGHTLPAAHERDVAPPKGERLMTSVAFSALASCVLVATGAETYADAHRQTAETGRPLVVLVSADWCPACQVMEQSVIPQARKRGLLGKVAFAIVNYDREQDLATQLTENGPIPQVVMYRHIANRWRKWRLIGGQSLETFEEFVRQGLEEADTPAASQSLGETAQGRNHSPR